MIVVSSSQATVLLDRQEEIPLEIGNLVKMPTRVGTAYAMVSRLEVKGPGLEPSERDLRIAEIEFAGEIGRDNVTFHLGTSSHPLLDDPVSLASHADLQAIYTHPDVASTAIGSIHQDSAVSAYVLIDKLLANNFSVVGGTGTGKSCLVAALLGRILECAPNAHLVVLDPHGEYSTALRACATVLSNGYGLYFPYWLFNIDELAAMLLGPEPQADQAKILADGVLAAKQSYFSKTGLERRGTVDTPAPYRIADVLSAIDNAMGALSPTVSVAAYRAVIARINALQNDARYSFVFNTRMTLRDELCDIIAQLLRIPVAGKPITILDLSGIPSEAMNVIVSVLCRVTFDFALWSAATIPITIICEEAHRYAPRDKSLGFEGAKRALFRIAKEGRKYGVSLCLVTQRPSDLAPGLLAECGTMCAFRINDQEDQALVRSAAPESSYGLLNFLPALRNAEMIAIGEGVSLPMRIRLAQLPVERRPKSASGSFVEAWQSERDEACVEETVERWRWGLRQPVR
jgi:uncharacterized protein